jgi:hypothetical protein
MKSILPALVAFLAVAAAGPLPADTNALDARAPQNSLDGRSGYNSVPDGRGAYNRRQNSPDGRSGYN